MKKFELTTESVLHFGRKLFRIKALVEFGNVKEGELGGFIEKEDNLSQEGDAWVSGNARVFGNAWVYDNARVSGNARVYGNAWVKKSTHIFQLGAIGSRNSFTTFFRVKTNQIFVACGCFLGSIDEFEKAVEETHAGTKHLRTYKLAIQLAKEQIELDTEEDSNP